ncbi:MAG: V4R domain-containing protein [Candidatus Helarchaeota archaeon]
MADEQVRLVVFSALLTALTDIMGRDGKNSVLKFAGLNEYINKNVPPSTDPKESIPYETFGALLKSMYELLGHGTNAILFESGRKFAVYLSPFGYSLKDVIKKLEKWLGGKWELKSHKKDEEIVRISDCPICRDLESKEASCIVIAGTLSRIKEESTGEKYDVKETKCHAKGEECCEFIIKRISEEDK